MLFTSRLDHILTARAELAAVPFSAARPGPGPGLPAPNTSLRVGGRRRSIFGVVVGFFVAVKSGWDALINFVTDRLEEWAAPKDDKQVAWTLGIGWACCGGGLAGGCLVFAKAT